MLGRLFKYVLNINTVWGLMILVAFGLCVAQHYLPTTSVIPRAALAAPGAHKLTITTALPDKPAVAHEYVVRVEGENLVLPVADRAARQAHPWLISARPADGAWLLKWDHATYGRYEVAVDAAPVAQGQLVTLQSLTDAAFDYAQRGFDVAIGLVAAMVLFLGLMKVGEDAGIVKLVARLVHPVIRLMFPEVPRDHPASGAILMNITTSVLGLGNAATPFGLKAMQELQKLNPHPRVATNAQAMLLAYNTAGFALLPTTLLAIRKSAGCSDPFEIIGPCMITGAVSTLVAIILARWLGRLPFFSVEAALAEKDAADAPPAETGPAATSAREEQR